jgi:hypothetical protein
MSRTVVVRYKTRPEAAEENQRLVERVFAELHEKDPGGTRYATFRLADGVTFIHVSVTEGDVSPVTTTAAFAEFQRGVDGRCVELPVLTEATVVGSYPGLPARAAAAAGE